MSVDLNTTVGAVEKVPLVYTNDAGTVCPPLPGGTVATSDATIATATVAADDGSVTVTAVAIGTATLTYTVETLTATLNVIVAALVATKVDFDTPAATPA